MESQIRYWTVAELARSLRVSKQKIYRLVREGNLRGIQLGRHGLRISQAAVDQFLVAHVVAGDE